MKIPGVLVLEDNKTYGRTANQKRVLYKCIPDNPQYPVYLIPYELKANFLKKPKNKYILFKFDNWNAKHPHGIITETLGDVDQLDIFYEYQLYCHHLYDSLTLLNQYTRSHFSNKTHSQVIDEIFKNPHYRIEDARDKTVFTIDPNHSTDFDDGFSIEENGSQTIVTIYIANVYLWIETMQLWNHLTERVSTIYLPDRKKTMLPSILSDTLCSLKAGEPRFAFALKCTLDSNTGQILQPFEYKNVLIQVSTNYRYEENNLLKCSNYKNLLKMTKMLTNETMENSHDLVAFWMVKMNSTIAEYMVREKIGIGRIVSNTPLENMNSDLKRTYYQWKYNTKGEYVLNTLFPENTVPYLHITSPIRRLVDLLNQTVLILHMGLITSISTECRQFIDKWNGQIGRMNESMRITKKVQSVCQIMHYYYTNPQVLDLLHTGIVFDKSDENTYTVFFEKIHFLTQIKMDGEHELFTKHKFKVFLFENEDKTKKKIRFQLADAV
jgi:exoribonuclease R